VPRTVAKAMADITENKKTPNDLARNISVYLLKESLKKAPEKVKNDIKSAIEGANDVTTSPIFSIKTLGG